MIHAYWSIFAINHWYDIAGEQLRCLSRAGFKETIHAHMIGNQQCRMELFQLAGWLGVKIEVTCHPDDANAEYYGLTAMQKEARQGKIMYWHAKAVTHPGWISYVKWRWMMDVYCLARWREREADLDAFDAVGCAYDPGRSMFLGNFWWVRSEWIAKLPPVELTPDRFFYERWLLSVPGASIKPLVSVGGEPCEDAYYVTNGQPQKFFLME